MPREKKKNKQTNKERENSSFPVPLYFMATEHKRITTKRANRKRKELQIPKIILDFPMKKQGENAYHLIKALPSLARLRELVSASTLFLCLGPAIFRALERGWKRDRERRWRDREIALIFNKTTLEGNSEMLLFSICRLSVPAIVFFI